MTTTHELPSGAKLEITLAPFRIARELEKAVALELKAISIDAGASVENSLKDLILVNVYSNPIEAALQKCMERVTYNGLKITPDTFEDAKAREDYHAVCFHVAEENLRPFLKSLYALFKELKAKIPTESAPASK